MDLLRMDKITHHAFGIGTITETVMIVGIRCFISTLDKQIVVRRWVSS